jgi:hypothetical protein
MAFNGSQHFKISRPFVNEDGVNVETITGTKTLTMKDSSVQILDNSSGSPLTCMLPSLVNGAFFWIKCAGSHAINVNEPATGSTVQALAAGETAYIVCSGTAWKVVIKA